jgi:DNA repair protein RadC
MSGRKGVLVRERATSGLVHKHPSGEPTPIRADSETSRQIVEIARDRGRVHDHIIVGRDEGAEDDPDVNLSR